MPQLTTWIQTYNRAHLLGETIQSVIDQTFTDQKIIIFDNGSTDNTKEVVDSFSDSRISYVRHEVNRPSTRFVGERMRDTDTDYLVVFHDDDKMFPWMLETLFDTLESNPTAGFASSSQIFPMGSSAIPPKPTQFASTLYRPFDYLRTYCQICWNPVVYPSIMYRKSMIQEKIEDASYLQLVRGLPTGDFFQSLWLNCNGVVFVLVDHPLMEYRLHGTQMSKLKETEEQIINTWRRFEQFIAGQSALHNLNLDLSRLRTKYAWYVFQNMDIKELQKKGILSLARTGQNQVELRGDLSILWEKRKFLEETLDWKMTDSDFYHSIYNFLSA